MVKIYIEKDDKTIILKLEQPIVVKEILKKLDISIESVIIQKNGNICLEDSVVSQEDELRLLSVVSGG